MTGWGSPRWEDAAAPACSPWGSLDRLSRHLLITCRHLPMPPVHSRKGSKWETQRAAHNAARRPAARWGARATPPCGQVPSLSPRDGSLTERNTKRTRGLHARFVHTTSHFLDTTRKQEPAVLPQGCYSSSFYPTLVTSGLRSPSLFLHDK